jgi:tetratricopeptide (TPR) repeat protein
LANGQNIGCIVQLPIFIAFIAFIVVSVVAPFSPPSIFALASTDLVYAEELIRQGQFDEAITSLSRFLATEPQNVEAHNLLGIAYTAKRELNSANLEYRKALKIRPDFVPALKNLAINELTQNAEPIAVRHFSAALKLAPTDPVIHAYMGKIAFSHHEFRSAADHLEKTKELLQDPTVASPLIESDLELGAPEKAAISNKCSGSEPAQCSMAVPPGPPISEARNVCRGDPLLSGGKQPGTGSEDAVYNLAACYVETKQFQEAIAILRATAERRNTPDVQNLLAEAYEGNGQTQEAIDALRAAIQLAPQDEESYVHLIALCTKYEAYDLALQIAEAGIDFHPQSDRLIFQRGVIYFMRGQPDLAEKDFQTARELAPEKDLNYAALGVSFIQTQNRQALTLLRERVKAKPNDFTLRYMLAESLFNSKMTPGEPEFAEARTAMEMAVKLNPNSSTAQADLGEIYVIDNQLDKAVEHLERARTLDPQNRAAYARLATAYRQQGKREQAKAMSLMVLKLNEEERTRDRKVRKLRVVSEHEQPAVNVH